MYVVNVRIAFDTANRVFVEMSVSLYYDRVFSR